MSPDEIEKPGSIEPRQFPVWISDYEIGLDNSGAQKVVGTGTWSTVYLANPTAALHDTLTMSNALLTPPPETTLPLTPIRSRDSNMPKPYPPVPSAYAIKVPYERTAHRVLAEESRILSYLSRFPSAERFLVPYYGQDTRNNAIVMGYLPTTLESFIVKDLNTRDESDRGAMLADFFPYIARSLLEGLAWLHDKSCVHGDLKPSNILMSTDPSTYEPRPVFADFSASMIISKSMVSGQRSPVGGATWDFIDPIQLTAAGASTLSTPTNDLWALAMMLLVLVTGVSPYERIAPNSALKREIMKAGEPLDYVSLGQNGVRSVLRMGGLSRALGFNVKKWFAKVLVLDPEKRMSVGDWTEELADALM